MPILDYVWVNEDYEIVKESIQMDAGYEEKIPCYSYDNIIIKPTQIFRNPFKSVNDLIVLCDMYNVNPYTEPPEILIAEHNQRKEFNQYMEQYPNTTFQISQKYKHDKNIFRQHKEMCKYRH